MSNSIDLKIKATFGDDSTEFDFNVTNEDLDDIKETAADQWNKTHHDPNDEESIEAEAGDMVLEVIDWDETPTQVRELTDEFFEFCDEFSRSSYEAEVFQAALDAGVQITDIDEAYAGSFSSDEDFARDAHDQTKSGDEPTGWPYSCIDWEAAAKELMYDYCSANGHYFRNL